MLLLPVKRVKNATEQPNTNKLLNRGASVTSYQVTNIGKLPKRQTENVTEGTQKTR